jgi:PEP-CTERM motif
MKNGLFAARSLSIIAILAFALPAFADTINLTAAPNNGTGPFQFGESSFAYQFPGGYGFGTAGYYPSALVNGTEAFQIYGTPATTVSAAGTLYTYSSPSSGWTYSSGGWLSFSAGSKSGSGSLSQITFFRGVNGVNTLSAIYTGTVNGKGVTMNFNQVLAFNNGGQGWSGGPLGNGTLASPVPEPSTLGLLGTGLFMIAGIARKRLVGQQSYSI